MIYSFESSIAAKYGVDEAIMLQHIYFWVAHNRANGLNEHDGKFWTFNSKKAFAELFPFWSVRSIERILKNLVDNGLILTGNFNETAYDRTTWYTLTSDALLVMDCTRPRNREMHTTEPWNGNHETVESIPPNRGTNTRYKPDIKPDNKPDILIPPPHSQRESDFERFWCAYPKHIAKQQCQRAWNAAKPPIDLVLTRIAEWKTSRQWKEASGQFIPHPLTWIRRRGWEEEVPEQAERGVKPKPERLDDLDDIF